MREQDAPDLGTRAGNVDQGVAPARLAREALDRRGGGRVEQRHARDIDHVGLRVLADPIERRRRPRPRHRRRTRRRCGRPRRRGRSRAPRRRACGRRRRRCRRDPPRAIGRLSISIACAIRCRNSSAPIPKPDHDALGQVAEHDQQEGRQQHHGVAARGSQQASRTRASRPCSRRRRPARPASAASGM